MMTDVELDAPSKAPMAKMLSVILIFGQVFLAIGVVCLFIMAVVMPVSYTHLTLPTTPYV